MLVLLLIFGCGDPCPDVAMVETGVATCDASSWHLEVEATGDAAEAHVRIVQSGMEPDPIWVEEHDLAWDSEDADTCTQTLVLDLPIVSSWEDQASNESSWFQCDDKNWLTFELTLYDSEGQVSECVVWGHFLDQIGDESCRRL